MKKKKIIWLITLILSLVVILSAATAVTASSVKTWKVFMTCGPEAGWNEANLPEFLKGAEEATGGKLKFEIFFAGEHPYKMGEILKAVKDGVTEVGEIGCGYVANIEPRAAVIELPMLFPNANFQLYKEILDDLRSEYFPPIWDKWNAVELVPQAWAAQQFFHRSTFLENWDSFKGQRIRSWSTPVGDLIKLLGATPVNVAFDEVYTGLQTGLFDGLMTDIGPAYRTRLLEPAKYVSYISSQWCFRPLLVNKNALEELPLDVRDALMGYMQENAEWWYLGMQRENSQAIEDAIMYDQAKIHPVPMKFWSEIRDKSYEGIWKPWIERMGPQGEEAFNNIAKIIIEKGYTVPGYKIK